MKWVNYLFQLFEPCIPSAAPELRTTAFLTTHFKKWIHVAYTTGNSNVRHFYSSWINQVYDGSTLCELITNFFISAFTAIKVRLYSFNPLSTMITRIFASETSRRSTLTQALLKKQLQTDMSQEVWMGRDRRRRKGVTERYSSASPDKLQMYTLQQRLPLQHRPLQQQQTLSTKDIHLPNSTVFRDRRMATTTKCRIHAYFRAHN